MSARRTAHRPEPRGFHVAIPGPNSAVYDIAHVAVDEVSGSETGWDYPGSTVRASVGWFETREEAIAFAREVFEPLGYRVDY